MSDKLKYQAKWPVLTWKMSYELKNKGAFSLFLPKKTVFWDFQHQQKPDIRHIMYFLDSTHDPISADILRIG
jgi:hypothetical protein